MENWIKKMNEMFEENVYTNEGRVTVDYCENAKSMFAVTRRSSKILIDLMISG